MPQKNDSAKQEVKMVNNPFVVEVEREVKVEKPVVAKQITRPPEPEAVKPMTLEQVIKKVEKVTATPKKQKERNWGMFVAGMITSLLLVAVAGGGWWWMQNRQTKSSVVITPSPTPQTVIEPSPIPIVWSRELITVEVLNGSGVTGKASEILGKIEELGYERGTTGNAASQVGSSISFSEDISTLSATILGELEEIVPGVTITSAPLTGANKIQVILGKE